MYNAIIESMQPAATAALMARAKELKRIDPDIVDMAGGEPDFDTPQRIKDELFRQINSNYTHYTPGTGLPELREGIAEKLKRENGCSYSPEGIIVTPGGKYGVYIAIRTLLNPGDEVIVLPPMWVSYSALVSTAGGVPVEVPLSPENGFRLDAARIEAAITEKTKLIIINYPNNPSGRILTRPEADALRDILLRHPGVFLLSDEIYERIVYGAYSISPASYPEIADRVITINGFSKSVAMTGFRIGYMAADTKTAKMASKLFSHTMTCTSGFIQKSAVAALGCQREIEEMRQKYEQRRDYLFARLQAMPRVYAPVPEGAFYAFVRFDLPGLTQQETAEYILTRAKVVGLHGAAFGIPEGGWMRFSFATDDAQIKKGADQLEAALNAFGK